MKKKNRRPLIIIILISSILLICIFVPVYYFFSSGGIRDILGAAPNQTQAPPVLTGRLIFQRVSTGDNGQSYTSEGFFELQGGIDAPIPATGLGFDPSVITGPILAISPDKRYMVFSPNNLLDTKTGQVTSLFSTANSIITNLVGHTAMFSPDLHYLAYTLWKGKFVAPILTVMDLTTKQSNQIYQTDCGTYEGGFAGTHCEGMSEASWIDSNTLLFTHLSKLPMDISNEDVFTWPDELTIITKLGDVVLSRPYAYGTGEDIWIYGNSVFLGMPSQLETRLDASELTKGNYQSHTVCNATSIHSYCPVATLSSDGLFILKSDRDSLTDFDVWQMLDFQTGHETHLGSQTIDPELIDNCLWSPNRTQVACTWLDVNRIYLFPLSSKSGGNLYKETNDTKIILIDWLP